MAQIHDVLDVHVAVQMHNCHIPSSADVMAEPVSTAEQHRKTATTKREDQLKLEDGE